ncbi:MAG: NAD(P)-binding domain-containing protein [Eubacteriales bacterium]|nr:NAD(P)-binding domain-containing protein [Eubacteriales bacterium]
MKVGFVGLGIMGSPMCKNILKAGFDLSVYALEENVIKEFEGLGATRASYAEMGATCDVVMVMVPTGAISKSIFFGEDGVASTAKPGTILVDLSSVTATESQECYKLAAEKGLKFLDAPVSGGEPKAIDGTLATMVGGDKDAFDVVKPVFDAFSSSALLVGPSGNGSITKLVNQIIVNNNIAIVGEAFTFAAKAGADPIMVYEAIRGGLAGSCVLDAKLPMMADRNFKPGGTLKVNHKDITNVLKTAHAIDCPVPYTAQLYEIMQALKVDGHIMDDQASYVTYFEKLAQVTVERK